MMRKSIYIISILLLTIFFTSCDNKNNPNGGSTPITLENRVGTYNGNGIGINASVSYKLVITKLSINDAKLDLTIINAGKTFNGQTNPELLSADTVFVITVSRSDNPSISEDCKVYFDNTNLDKVTIYDNANTLLSTLTKS